MVRTDGRGCPANNGDAPGQQPLLGGSSYRSALLSGGSGGGNGGAGGVSGVSPASAITYATQIAGGTGMENYPESGQAISAGSGGGAGFGYSANTTQNSIAAGQNTYYTESVANNYDFTLIYGAGGGMVVIYSGIGMVFNGIISCNGAQGGVTLNTSTSTFPLGNDTMAYAGNGGGAGGTAVLITPELRGNGTVFVTGGSGFICNGTKNSVTNVPKVYVL